MKDLAAPGEQLVVARGGKGGKGNVRFKSSTNRAPASAPPAIRASRGGAAGTEGDRRRRPRGQAERRQEHAASRLSRVRPRIAAYPFTTKHPNLGRVQIDADRALIMADIPGLIEGAHAGAGLGHEFLRHVERTGLLVHLLEPQPGDGSDPLANYRAIRGELEQHSTALAARGEMVVVTKADLPGAEAVRRKVADALGRDVLLISAVTGQGLNQLTGALAAALNKPAKPW